MQYSIAHDPSPHEVEQFANLKLPRIEGNFIGEGVKVVEQLLQSAVAIDSLYLTEDHFAEQKQLIEAHEQDREAKIFIASKKSMEKIVGFTLHQGILAAGQIPNEPLLDDIIATAPKPQLFIILDTIADAENIGTLYRTALAMGVSAMIIDDQSVNPWIRRAVRVSMGAVFKLPTITTNLVEAIGKLKAQNITVISTSLEAGASPLWESSDLSSSIALVFGSEGFGIRKALLHDCSSHITIPMSAGVDSLNVAVAQGVVLYEVLRQRSLK